MFECFHCGEQTVIWDSDYSYEEWGLEGEGIVQVLHCTNCGAEITYYISDESNEEQDLNPTLFYVYFYVARIFCSTSKNDKKYAFFDC